MVKPILRDIRTVVGVTGVALLRKRDGLTEDIFPAAFTQQHAGELYHILANVYRHLRGFSRLVLTFDRVTVFLYNQPEYLLLATTLPDLDRRTFEIVINSKFGALTRVLDAVPLRGKPAEPAHRGSTKEASSVEAILMTLNRLADKLTTECGRTKVSHCWREARRAAGVTFPVLSLFTVDANGHWEVRKGQQTQSVSEAGQALADVVERFLDQLGPLQPRGIEILGALVANDADRLEQTGFVHFLKSIRPLHAPARRT